MAPYYNKPAYDLVKDMVTNDLKPAKGDVITRDQVVERFAKQYSKIKESTIGCCFVRLSTNAPSRYHYGAKPTDDLLYQLDGSRFRLYDPERDPQPLYGPPTPSRRPPIDDVQEPPGEFAYETDLRNYLAKNLGLLEPGLRLYRDEEAGTSGIEFPAGGRFIDILAVDSRGGYVVIELKVSRGYDRVVGQLLRYMAWTAENHADPAQPVRGVIVARDISEDLTLACSGLSAVTLFEYDLSVQVRKVERGRGAADASPLGVPVVTEVRG